MCDRKMSPKQLVSADIFGSFPPPPKAGFPAAVQERSPRSSPELSEHLLSLFETVTGSRIKTNVP